MQCDRSMGGHPTHAGSSSRGQKPVGKPARRQDWRPHRLQQATKACLAASSITAATLAGSSRITMWQVCSVVVTAPIFLAADASMAGGTIRSLAEMIAHVGLVFHA